MSLPFTRTQLLITICVGLVLAILLLVGLLSTRRECPPCQTEEKKTKTAPSDVVIHVAWEEDRDPTDEDKVVLHNSDDASKSYTCPATSLFSEKVREVKIRLPPGSYVGKTSQKGGENRLCGLDEARRVVFAGGTTRCTSQAEGSPLEERHASTLCEERK